MSDAESRRSEHAAYVAGSAAAAPVFEKRNLFGCFEYFLLASGAKMRRAAVVWRVPARSHQLAGGNRFRLITSLIPGGSGFFFFFFFFLA